MYTNTREEMREVVQECHEDGDEEGEGARSLVVSSNSSSSPPPARVGSHHDHVVYPSVSRRGEVSRMREYHGDEKGAVDGNDVR